MKKRISVAQIQGWECLWWEEDGNREMIFPVTWVIIPCYVALKNRDCVASTRVDSV